MKWKGKGKEKKAGKGRAVPGLGKQGFNREPHRWSGPLFLSVSGGGRPPGFSYRDAVAGVVFAASAVAGGGVMGWTGAPGGRI